MNHETSPYGRLEDDVQGSPKRKKVRAKYAPKACVSCRRSKLKCSGENPCGRCSDNGKRCFYSEDQTAAEALQHLSRPTPVQQPSALNPHANANAHTHTHASSNGNGNGIAIPRRSIIPRHESMGRRTSDASVPGNSLEARMARMEGMMEVLIQERGIGSTPRGSIEREEAFIDGFHGDTALHPPIEAFSANLAAVRQQLGFPPESPELRTRQSISAVSPSSSTESMSNIRVGSRTLSFPNPSDYQKYIDYFFSSVTTFYPCVNEAEFRARGESMLATRVIDASDISFLALNYIVFSCSDILVDTTHLGTISRPPGWQWFQLADQLVGKRKVSGRGDLYLIQFLIWEALYLVCADKPNAAYNVIGIACRLSFQFGLHQQSCWGNCTPLQIHMRQRIFWTIYFADRRISLSCGRPYGIRDLDIDVDQPSWIYDRDIQLDQPLPPRDLIRSANLYLSCMIQWGKLCGDVWDRMFAAAATQGMDGESTAILDAKIKHWTEVCLPAIPLLPKDHTPEIRHQRQHTLVYTRLNHLRLLLRRRTMISLRYDGSTGRLCGDLAISNVQLIKAHSTDAKGPSSFRYHMTASLGGSILILATLLVRDLVSIGLQDQQTAYAESFRDALAILQDLSIYLQAARRVIDDFRDIVNVVTTILNQGVSIGPEGEKTTNTFPANIDDLFPYGALDFAQQASTGQSDTGRGGATGSGNGNAGAQWTSSMESATAASLDSWDFELQPTSVGGYGVPWI
ncbi:hypothetical protein K504DRAFT_462421 [Pleomassaria siparia CBS 279.74]|uniref:Zn(2)-C6 fungal-type domain-containing protein n=1 Tax=Pleomassaria siparia CBS 279.74 TaxID=1314801 RepID=A0A6G1KMV0_9PLEO|nr:hypothetical protein K504DRAFT_462421 [Pleomassaria siparia CBS 279.74]